MNSLNTKVVSLEFEKGIDLRRHINECQQVHPEATGELTGLLSQITLSAKIVSRAVNRAGLIDILGSTGDTNVHGEEKAELDVYANKIFKRNLKSNAGVSLIASEEEEETVEVENPENRGKYVVSLDPLDGSSNIEFNVSIGSIFGIYRKRSGSVDKPCTDEDILQKGRKLVASGYVIYGSSTMLVYSTGNGVHGFTLDTSIGEFLLCQPDISIPETGGAYSVNESYFPNWENAIQESVSEFKDDSDFTARYIGSLVADFHRTLLGGGVFLYPNEPDTPGKENGKLRLLYEAAPLAFLAREAGGRASNGRQAILDIKPERLHQRVPLYIGSRQPVNRIEKKVRGKQTTAVH